MLINAERVLFNAINHDTNGRMSSTQVEAVATMYFKRVWNEVLNQFKSVRKRYI